MQETNPKNKNIIIIIVLIFAAIIGYGIFSTVGGESSSTDDDGSADVFASVSDVDVLPTEMTTNASVTVENYTNPIENELTNPSEYDDASSQEVTTKETPTINEFWLQLYGYWTQKNEYYETVRFFFNEQDGEPCFYVCLYGSEHGDTSTPTNITEIKPDVYLLEFYVPSGYYYEEYYDEYTYEYTVDISQIDSGIITTEDGKYEFYGSTYDEAFNKHLSEDRS